MIRATIDSGVARVNPDALCQQSVAVVRIGARVSMCCELQEISLQGARDSMCCELQDIALLRARSQMQRTQPLTVLHGEGLCLFQSCAAASARGVVRPRGISPLTLLRGWQDHRVDHVNRAVRSMNVRGHHRDVVHVHFAVNNLDVQRRAVERLGLHFVGLDHVGCERMPEITWYVRMAANFVLSFSNSSTVPAGSFANAASVGAKTVNWPLPWSSVIKSAALSAATSVVDEPFFNGNVNDGRVGMRCSHFCRLSRVGKCKCCHGCELDSSVYCEVRRIVDK